METINKGNYQKSASIERFGMDLQACECQTKQWKEKYYHTTRIYMRASGYYRTMQEYRRKYNQQKKLNRFLIALNIIFIAYIIFK